MPLSLRPLGLISSMALTLALPGCAPDGAPDPSGPGSFIDDGAAVAHFDAPRDTSGDGQGAPGRGPGIIPPVPEGQRHEGVLVERRAEGEAELLPEPAQITRARRRMDLDQLSASVRRVTGGVGWTELRNGVEVDLFEELSSTLGKPDYVEITAESLEPSALFQKFLADAARSVCARVTERDQRLPRAERVLTPAISLEADRLSDGPAVDANLRALMMRFHGQRLPPGDPALEEWKWLFDAVVHLTESPSAAWNAVCVGLITHPDFYTY